MDCVVDLVSDDEELPGPEPDSTTPDPQPLEEEKLVSKIGTEGNDIVDLVSDEEDVIQNESVSCTSILPTSCDSPKASHDVPISTKDVQSYKELIKKLVIEELEKNQRFQDQLKEEEDLLEEYRELEKEMKELIVQNAELDKQIDRLSKDVTKETTIHGQASCTADGFMRVTGPFQRIVPISTETHQVISEAAYNTDENFVCTGSTNRICFDEEANRDFGRQSPELEEILHRISSIDIPPAGPLVMPELKPGDDVYARTSFSFPNEWKSSVVKIVNKSPNKYMSDCVVEFKDKIQVLMSSKELAYASIPNVLLPVGTRVIAYYKSEPHIPKIEAILHSGMVAETPKLSNNSRYLIFFDHGPVCYVTYEELHQIVNPSNAWDEALPQLRSFFKTYCDNFPDRAMIKFQRGEKMKVRVDESWFYGQVVDIDNSLVKFKYERLERSEWVYRGSFRLHQLWTHVYSQQASQSSNSQSSQGFKPRRKRLSLKSGHQPYIQYTRDEFDVSLTESSCEPVTKKTPVAKKSTAKDQSKSGPSSTPSTIIGGGTQEVVLVEVPIDYENNATEIKEENPHGICYFNCHPKIEFSYDKFRNINPYAIPVMMKWQRKEIKTRRSRYVEYIAPCGKSCGTIDEVQDYLNNTHCSLPISLFTFQLIDVYKEKEVKKSCYYFDEDLAQGKENHSITVINEVDTKGGPEPFVYEPNRMEGPGVSISKDPAFRACCTCTDNCKNRITCQCQRSTVEAADDDVGYESSRLKSFVMTGIFECNDMCSCRENCPNRVVQNGITVQLQLFKTLKKGWGVRCLHDIPQGAFICTYSAEIMKDTTELESDKYFADLDYIDICEDHKAGYEEEAAEMTDQEDEQEQDDNNKGNGSPKASKKMKVNHPDDDEDEDDEPEDDSKRVQKQPSFSIRKYFREDFSYTLDAMLKGNIGRFMNHSCGPNSFVQNVFVDTHDLRFPWVALFAARDIPAFEEICWDYNYQVGSVSGRKLYCHCGYVKCRGRLL